MSNARAWHWIQAATLQTTGVMWRPKIVRSGRYTGSDGYIYLSPGAMTLAEIATANRCNLWRDKRHTSVAEHRLKAAIVWGSVVKGCFVRHLNGDKTDNRLENLLLGTAKENAADHHSATKLAIWWRMRCEELQRRVAQLEAELLGIRANTG